MRVWDLWFTLINSRTKGNSLKNIRTAKKVSIKNVQQFTPLFPKKYSNLLWARHSTMTKELLIVKNLNGYSPKLIRRLLSFIKDCLNSWIWPKKYSMLGFLDTWKLRVDNMTALRCTWKKTISKCS